LFVKIKDTNVACANCPSMNTFFIFHIFKIVLKKKSAMWTCWRCNWFFFPNPKFAIFLNL
jgi:hypothetical protein